ncbi:MAG: DoxX family protein [Dysgonamonadaceae bacterium]|jgi:putative oxidoreductase|nr:DoxX family protein [Dysgonamonadaceae bacterium]
MKLMSNSVSFGVLIIRLSIGVLMLLHGIHKLFHGIGFIERSVVSAHLPAFFAYGVFIGEIIAPLMIIAGYRTRLGALIFAVNCIAAVLLVHKAGIFALNAQGGWSIELLGLYFFGALMLLFTGGGKYAISRKSIFD